MGTVGFQTTAFATWLPEQDPRLVYRLVGFFEYGQAIERLDRFVKSATPAERTIANELIQEQDQFAIYTFGTTVSSSELDSSLPRKSGFPISATQERRGLDWVMAFARVELGAMLAGFTSRKNPFHTTAPTVNAGSDLVRFAPSYEMEAYRVLLNEGLWLHYTSLKNDRAVKEYYTKGIPESHLVTYGRRATVTRQFLRAVRDFADPRAREPLAEPTEKWDSELRKLQLMILYCVAMKTGTHRETTYFDTLNCNCPGLVSQAREAGVLGSRTKSFNTPRLHELLRLIDPTLVALPCL